MLGVIVVAKSEEGGLGPSALLEDFLGAPLLARAIAGALPANEAAYVVLLVAPGMKDEIAASVVERFGLDEVEQVLEFEGDRCGAIRGALTALPDDIDTVVVTEGARMLVPSGLVENTVAAAREHGAAAPAVELLGAIVADEDGAVPVDIRPRLRSLQGPQAFRRDVIAGALDGLTGSIDVAEAAAHAGATVTLVDGDRDNFEIQSAADRGRALEVFARRAVDYAFVYPSDLLPDDPLRAALTPGSGAPVEAAAPEADGDAAPASEEAQASDDEGSSAEA